MKERGILFTPANIKLIRDKRKWQTRRVASFPSWVTSAERIGKWFHGYGDHPYGECEEVKCAHIGGLCGEKGPFPSMFTLQCPYGVPGDRLYVKEGIILDFFSGEAELTGYYMDGARATLPREKRLTAMFMPKWAARTWLEITDVRIQRLQDISEEDAKAEGATPDICKCDRWEYSLPGCEGCDHNYRRGFEELWDSINKKKHPWESNPWVFAITFRKV
jgi:hypothetical protein